MIVEPFVGDESEIGDEILAHVRDAVTIGVLEPRQERIVRDVKPAIIPGRTRG
jgi:hypothetical protein